MADCQLYGKSENSKIWWKNLTQFLRNEYNCMDGLDISKAFDWKYVVKHLNNLIWSALVISVVSYFARRILYPMFWDTLLTHKMDLHHFSKCLAYFKILLFHLLEIKPNCCCSIQVCTTFFLPKMEYNPFKNI